jgi:hypothetical protein
VPLVRRSRIFSQTGCVAQAKERLALLAKTALPDNIYLGPAAELLVGIAAGAVTWPRRPRRAGRRLLALLHVLARGADAGKGFLVAHAASGGGSMMSTEGGVFSGAGPVTVKVTVSPPAGAGALETTCAPPFTPAAIRHSGEVPEKTEVAVSR